MLLYSDTYTIDQHRFTMLATCRQSWLTLRVITCHMGSHSFYLPPDSGDFPALLASPTSAHKDFDPQPKLVLIFHPGLVERLS